MIDYDQFRTFFVLPVCRPFPKPEAAATQLMRHAAHEHIINGKSYVRQVSNSRSGYGPARSPFQIETATKKLADVWVTKNWNRLARPRQEMWAKHRCDHADELMWNMRAAALYARVLCFASVLPIPDASDERAAYDFYLEVWGPGAVPSFSKWIGAWRRWEAR